MPSVEELPRALIRRFLGTIKKDPLASGALKSLIVENIKSFSKDSLSIELSANDLDSLEQEMLEKAGQNPLLFTAIIYAIPKAETMIAGSVGPLTRGLFREHSKNLIAETLKPYMVKIYGEGFFKNLEELKKAETYEELLRIVVEYVEKLGVSVPGSIEINALNKKEIEVITDPCTFTQLSLKLRQEGITSIFGETFCAFGTFLVLALEVLSDKTVDFEPVELSPPTCKFKLKIL